jgi:hypothetical protein
VIISPWALLFFTCSLMKINLWLSLMNHTEHKKRVSPLFLILIVIIGLNIVHTVSFSVLYTYAKVIGNPLIYHLSSDEPWRATVAISDATTMLKLGHNVTLLKYWRSTDWSQTSSSLSRAWTNNRKRNQLYLSRRKGHYLWSMS